jgi:hypothetical protein
MYKILVKILEMPDDRYLRRCYSMLLHLHKACMKIWVMNVKALLFRYGFQYVWIYQGVGDVGCFVNIFTQRVKDTWVEELHCSVSGHSKLQFHNEVTSLLEPRKYISCVTNRQRRIAFSILRISSYNLEIVTGRQHNTYEKIDTAHIVSQL